MALMCWADHKINVRGGRWEVLRLLHHIPNGGARTKAEGGIFKAMGVKAGVPDLFLPVPAKGCDGTQYHGLYIEMKAEGGRLQPSQRQWLDELCQQGYGCCVCYSAEDAEECLTDYLFERWSQSDGVVTRKGTGHEKTIQGATAAD